MGQPFFSTLDMLYIKTMSGHGPLLSLLLLLSAYFTITTSEQLNLANTRGRVKTITKTTN